MKNDIIVALGTTKDLGKLEGAIGKSWKFWGENFDFYWK
jgi:hypothetical protein